MTTRTVFGQLLAMLLALCLTFPATVWAQEDGAAKAAALYDEATVAYQQGDYKKAADLLDLAFGANPDLVYKYNRILALQALEEYELALTELNAMYTPMKADNQNRFDDVDEIKAQLEAAIARNQPEEPPPGEEPPLEGPTTPASKPNYLAWGLIGGGALLLGAGGLLATEIFLPNEDARGKQQIASLSLMGGGLIVAGVGIVLLLLPDKKESSATTGLDSLQLAPYVTHQGAGATFHLRF